MPKILSPWILYACPHEIERYQERPGVYVVYEANRPVYVGSSLNVRHRIRSHKIRLAYSRGHFGPWGYFRRMRIKVKYSCRMGDWAMTEVRLIHRLRPQFNVLLKKDGHRSSPSCSSPR